MGGRGEGGTEGLTAFLFMSGNELSEMCCARSCRQPELCSATIFSVSSRHCESTPTANTCSSETPYRGEVHRGMTTEPIGLAGQQQADITSPQPVNYMYAG